MSAFNLSKRIIDCECRDDNCPEKLVTTGNVKEFIKKICAKMNCGWRVDIIKNLAGKGLT